MLSSILLLQGFLLAEEALPIKEQDLLPVPSPFSPKLEGEILRDRIAVLVIRWTARLHLERMFARMYCRSKSER